MNSDTSVSNYRKKYIKRFYYKIWIKKRKRLGFHQYDKDLISYICTLKGNVLDVAIGDGVPYSESLLNHGYSVSGVDLSPDLVEMVRNKFPDIKVKVGDAENLPFEDNSFDIVICFRSMWYFPDVLLAIKEFLRVVKHGGVILFDVQNALHPVHNHRVHKHDSIFVKYLKNFVKITLSPFKNYFIDWSWKNTTNNWITPTNPQLLINHFKKNKIEYSIWGVDWGKTPTLTDAFPNLKKYDRLVFRLKT